MLSWESESTRIFDFSDSVNHINYRGPIYCYLGVAFLTVIYSIAMTVLGCGGFDIPPLMVSTKNEFAHYNFNECMRTSNYYTALAEKQCTLLVRNAAM